MKPNSLRKTILILLVFLPSLCAAQLRPHIKTFGYDYGFPRTTENLVWLATHHDVVIGIGDFQTKKVTEAQYDTLKAANPNIIIIPYVVIQAFTFEPMEDFMRAWASANGYDPEDLYLHYYYDQVVRTQVLMTKTSGTGTPSDRVCDKDGNLIADGLQSNYYISLGYGGGGAKNLAEARTFQYWNAGFEARMNHLSTAWKGAYQAYILDVLTVTSDKYCDGVMLDTYIGVVDTSGPLPNMHQLIEVRNANYGASDETARTWYAGQIASYWDDLRNYLKPLIGKSLIYFIPNSPELGYTYTTYKFAVEDQFAPTKLTEATVEFTTSPSKPYYFIDLYFRKHYDTEAGGLVTFFNHLDTAWYHYGQIPPIGGKQFMIGTLYLYNHPSAYFGLHYGTASSYGPGIYPNIGEAKGGVYADSHWDKMMEFDIGTPVVRSGVDFWGIANTDRAYLVESEASGSWDSTLGRTEPRGRFVLAREYTKALIIVRYEVSNNNSLSELGTEPRTYQLSAEYQRLLEDNSFGPVVTEITLGLSEGAILIKKEFATPPWTGPIIDQTKTKLLSQ